MVSDQLKGKNDDGVIKISIRKLKIMISEIVLFPDDDNIGSVKIIEANDESLKDIPQTWSKMKALFY